MDDHFTSRPDLDQSALMERLRSGEVAAFRQIYLEHFLDLCHHASTIVTTEDARDVVQDVLWNLWTSRTRLSIQTDRELTFYLLRAVRNRALDMLRRTRVRDQSTQAFVSEIPETLTAGMSQEIDEPGAPFADWNDEPDTVTGRIRTIIGSLPERSREILMLRWYHGLGLEEIADIMKISYGSARVLHSRALALVKERIGLK